MGYIYIRKSNNVKIKESVKAFEENIGGKSAGQDPGKFLYR